MRVIDKRPKVSRRNVLVTGGATLAAVTVAPSGAISGKAFAATPVAVKPETFTTLVKMARDIYPHDKVADRHYAKVIEGLDAAAKADLAKRNMLEQGVAGLNKAANANKFASYADGPTEKDRVAILKTIETTPFFQTVRGALITGLYNNKELWPQFGYEGESYSKGGYINRGFDDINWLDRA